MYEKIKLINDIYAVVLVVEEPNNYTSPIELDHQNAKVKSFEIVRKARYQKILISINYIYNNKEVSLFENLEIKTFTTILGEFYSNKLVAKKTYKLLENEVSFVISTANNTPTLVLKDSLFISKLEAKIITNKLDYLLKNYQIIDQNITEYYGEHR